MNKVVLGAVVFLAILLLFLGVIFLIAGGLENAATGGVLVLLGAGLLYFVYRQDKIEAAKPTLVSQTFNVKMDGSGTMTERQLKCKSCGAPILDKDLKVIQGGVMMTCPYCGAMSALEEAPRW